MSSSLIASSSSTDADVALLSPMRQGEDEIDEDDILDLMMAQQVNTASAAPRGGALAAVRSAKAEPRKEKAAVASRLAGGWASRLLAKVRGGGGHGRSKSGPVAESIVTPVRKSIASSQSKLIDAEEMDAQVSCRFALSASSIPHFSFLRDNDSLLFTDHLVGLPDRPRLGHQR